MKVKTIERFTDLEGNKVRELNDEFEVTQKRFDELNALGLVEVVKVTKKVAKKKSGEK